MSGARASGQDGWFTTTVRPAGPLDHAALARLSETLGALEPSSDMVVVDLTAADVRDPRGLARHLLAPARRFDQAGRCMLVVGASPGLKAELGRAAVPVVTLASEGAAARGLDYRAVFCPCFRRSNSRTILVALVARSMAGAVASTNTANTMMGSRPDAVNGHAGSRWIRDQFPAVFAATSRTITTARRARCPPGAPAP